MNFTRATQEERLLDNTDLPTTPSNEQVILILTITVIPLNYRPLSNIYNRIVRPLNAFPTINHQIDDDPTVPIPHIGLVSLEC